MSALRSSEVLSCRFGGTLLHTVWRHTYEDGTAYTELVRRPISEKAQASLAELENASDKHRLILLMQIELAKR